MTRAKGQGPRGRGARGAGRAGGSAELARLQALAHPLRVRLFELFARAPRTTKQAAEHLGLPPTRLYHHVAALERVGLVRLTETRRKRGTIEKYFEAVPLRVGATTASAPAMSRRRNQLATDALMLTALLLERAREDCLSARAIRRRRRERAAAPTAARVSYHFDAARLPRVRRAVMALVKRLRALSIDPRTRAAPRWMFTLALVPTPADAPPSVSRVSVRRAGVAAASRRSSG